MEATKARQVRVYLKEKELQTLNELVERTGMRDTAVLSLLCVAALRAAKEADYRMPLPLKFNISEGSPTPRLRR
jgi:hypothetical protein